MLKQRVEALLERKRELLLARDVSRLTELFRAPLPIYHPRGLKVVTSSADLRGGVEKIARGMDDIGVGDVSIRVLEAEEPVRAGHLTATVEIRYFDQAGQALRRSRIRYFIHDDERDGLVIVMLEYLEAGFVEFLEVIRTRIC